MLTALHVAVGKRHLEIVKLIIFIQNFDLGQYGRTLLHIAAEVGDPNILGQHGGTALHGAAQFGHLHIVKYLTDKQGCNPACLSVDKNTPLHLGTL